MKWVLALLCGASLLSSCGYKVRRQEFSLAGVGTNRSEWRIFIPVVDNLLAETGFESDVTAALRRVLGGVRGLRVVASEEEADLVLLAQVQELKRARGEWTAPGSPSTAAKGGLAEEKFTAANVVLSMKLEASLLRKLEDSSNVKERLWTRTFTGSGRYDTSRRFYESGKLEGASGGSSSAPYVNRSREQILINSIAQGLAQSVVDQVVQDF